MSYQEPRSYRLKIKISRERAFLSPSFCGRGGPCEFLIPSCKTTSCDKDRTSLFFLWIKLISKPRWPVQLPGEFRKNYVWQTALSSLTRGLFFSLETMRIMAHIAPAYKRARVSSVFSVSQQIVCDVLSHSALLLIQYYLCGQVL